MDTTEELTEHQILQDSVKTLRLVKLQEIILVQREATETRKAGWVPKVDDHFSPIEDEAALEVVAEALSTGAVFVRSKVGILGYTHILKDTRLEGKARFYYALFKNSELARMPEPKMYSTLIQGNAPPPPPPRAGSKDEVRVLKFSPSFRPSEHERVKALSALLKIPTNIMLRDWILERLELEEAKVGETEDPEETKEEAKEAVEEEETTDAD